MNNFIHAINGFYTNDVYNTDTDSLYIENKHWDKFVICSINHFYTHSRENIAVWLRFSFTFHSPHSQNKKKIHVCQTYQRRLSLTVYTTIESRYKLVLAEIEITLNEITLNRKLRYMEYTS